MTSVLVSGAPAHVDRVAAALRKRGADVTEVTDLEALGSVIDSSTSGAFDAYVQLASSFSVRGDTAIQRVHHFYAGGVLARFTALDRVVPALAQSATVTFVMGALPAEGSSTEDVEARRALTCVLARAAQADQAPGQLSIEILGADASAEDVATAAMAPNTRHVPPILADPVDYADWRVEVLGLAMLET